jgi:hypothetical protein
MTEAQQTTVGRGAKAKKAYPSYIHSIDSKTKIERRNLDSTHTHTDAATNQPQILFLNIITYAYKCFIFFFFYIYVELRANLL